MAVNRTKTITDQHGNSQAGGPPPGAAAPGPAPTPPRPARAGPAPPPAPRPSRSATAGEVVVAYLRLQAQELRSLVPAVRADDYDAVHQMRVATRRLRATL